MSTTDETTEPLIGNESEDGLEPVHKGRARSGLKILILCQVVTLCLLPISYLLGYSYGTRELPRLPTHRTIPSGYLTQH